MAYIYLVTRLNNLCNFVDASCARENRCSFTHSIKVLHLISCLCVSMLCQYYVLCVYFVLSSSCNVSGGVRCVYSECEGKLHAT